MATARLNDNWLERLPFASYSESPYHMARYHYAVEFTRHRIVADIACGSGFGTVYLAQNGARSIIGLDLDSEVIEAQRRDLPPNVTFAVGSATAVPLPSHSVDVVVSFETIEHIRDVEACLQEFRRILKPDGLLILSTPNAFITQPINGVPRNPYHVKEYEPLELQLMLHHYFTEVKMIGQRVRGTVAVPDHQATKHRVLLGRVIRTFPLRWRQAFPYLVPRRIADGITKYVTGHRAFIAEDDLEFVATAIEQSPVLVALCRDALPAANT